MFMPLEILEVHSDCAVSQSLLGRGGWLLRLRSRCGAVRIFGHGGHFSRQAQGNRFFGGPKSTFRDRRKGSERFYFEMQISWHEAP